MIQPRSQAALSPEEKERINAVDRYMIEGAVDPLLTLLGDPSWTVRRAVVRALAAMGDSAVRPLHTLLLEHRDDEALVAATVDALAASIGNVEPIMVAAVNNDNPAVVADAAQILGRRRASAAVPSLTTLLQHADDNVAVAAIEALGRIGGRAAIESLLALVSSGNFFRTFPAIDVLGRSGDPRAVAPLAALLDKPTFAPEAARALGRSGERSAVAPLAALLSRPAEASVRVAALALAELHERYRERFGVTAPIEDALRQSVSDTPQAVRRLTQTLSTADAAEQVAVARLLGILRDDSAVAALMTLLDRPTAVAAAASEALQQLAGGEDDELIRDLQAADSTRRRLLLPLMTRSASIEAVKLCLGDEDSTVRATACETLARIGNPLAVRALFGLLGDGNPRVTHAAVAAIQSLGSAETETLSLAAARSPDAAVRRSALRILSYFGYGSALPLFIEAIDADDARAREIAVQGLPFIEDLRAMETLLAASRAPNERLRATANRALGQCRGGDARVISALLRGLSDIDGWVRYYACQSLGRLGAEAAASAIAGRIVDDAGQVRVAAIEALSHLRSEVAFTALRDAAHSSDADIRRAALVGLGLSRRAEAASLLFDACADNDGATRLVALSAIADFDEPETLPALCRAADDADESVRIAAVGFLAARTDRAATEALIGLLPRVSDRERIIGALALPSDSRIAALTSALRDADDELAPLLVSALVRMRKPEANAALVQSFGLPNVRARKAVASGLSALSSAEAFVTLQRAASYDPNPEVRRIAALLLAQ